MCSPARLTLLKTKYWIFPEKKSKFSAELWRPSRERRSPERCRPINMAILTTTPIGLPPLDEHRYHGVRRVTYDK